MEELSNGRAGLGSKGRVGIECPRRRGRDRLISHQRSGRPFRKKAAGPSSGYSACGGIGHHKAPAPLIRIPDFHSHPPADTCSRLKTHLIDLLINR